MKGIPLVESDWKNSNDELSSTTIPYDGEMLVNLEDELDSDEDWDDPFPQVADVFDPMPPIALSGGKVVAFDIFDAVFDREAAITTALTNLFSTPTTFADRMESLVGHFLEYKALAIRAAPLAPYTEIARKAVQDVCSEINLPVDQALLDNALGDLMQPHLHCDVLESLTAMRTNGFTLIGLSRIDELTFEKYFRGSVPSSIHEILSRKTCSLLCMLRDEFFPALIPKARTFHPDIEPSGVLFVTTSHTASLIPAHAAGFPSALIRHPSSVVLKSAFCAAEPTFTFDSLLSISSFLNNSSAIDKREGPTVYTSGLSFILSDFWYCNAKLGTGSFASVFGGSNIISGEPVAVKLETLRGHGDEKEVVPYEAMIYRRLRGHTGIPSVHWSGRFDISNVLVLDELGPSLQELRYVCRGRFSLKTISMLALQMLNRIEFVHSRSLIVRDIKPENFAMGLGPNASNVYLFDFGLAKLFENPDTGEHIPFREGRGGMGTPRYCSYNMEFGRDQSRRDDLEAIGSTLLFFYHGSLPWQGIYAPSIPWKYQRLGEMKSGDSFRELLAQSPPEFAAYFKHVRGLAFEDKPDYAFLSGLFERRMEEEDRTNDGTFDWINARELERGTRMPGEYKFEMRFAETLDERLSHIV